MISGKRIKKKQKRKEEKEKRERKKERKQFSAISERLRKIRISALTNE